MLVTWPIRIWDPCHVGSLFLRQAWRGWRHAIVRQGTDTIVYRRVRRTLAYLSCLLCVLLTQSKCNVSYWYKRLLRLHIWVVFSSDTTGFSHPHIHWVYDNTLYQRIQRWRKNVKGKCSSWLNNFWRHFIGFYDNTLYQRIQRWCKNVKGKCSSWLNNFRKYFIGFYDNTLYQRIQRWRKNVKCKCSSWLGTVCKNNATKIYYSKLSV